MDRGTRFGEPRIQDVPTVRFLSHGAERTGPPIYLLRLLREWHRRDPGFRPEVVLGRPGELLADFAAVAPTRVARLDRSSPERLVERALGGRIGHRAVAVATAARVGRSSPDITVINGATKPTVRLLRLLPGDGPVVTIAHELATGWFANLDAADRHLLLDRTARFLAVSSTVERFLTDVLGVDRANVEMIHPPVAVVDVPPDAAREPVVAGVGVTDWRKAPEVWLRVAATLKSILPDRSLRFVWIGGSRKGDPDFWPLEHEARHLGLSDDVHFVGAIDDPSHLLAGASVLVSTAREDAYPLACLEALAAGTPVVGFEGDGVEEMIAESGGGAVVPYPDDRALARQVARIIERPALRTSMGIAGQRFVAEQLAPDVIAPAVARWITAVAR